jgi:uncharacterized coiled-coil DUF342 family protein
LQAERSSIIAELKPLSAENKQYNEVVNEKIKEMEPLRNSLGKFREENNAMRAQSAGLCSSIEELDLTVCPDPFSLTELSFLKQLTICCSSIAFPLDQDAE